jgi:uncharacterized membrane protein YfhO
MLNKKIKYILFTYLLLLGVTVLVTLTTYKSKYYFNITAKAFQNDIIQLYYDNDGKGHTEDHAIVLNAISDQENTYSFTLDNGTYQNFRIRPFGSVSGNKILITKIDITDEKGKEVKNYPLTEVDVLGDVVLQLDNGQLIINSVENPQDSNVIIWGEVKLNNTFNLCLSILYAILVTTILFILGAFYYFNPYLIGMISQKKSYIVTLFSVVLLWIALYHKFIFSSFFYIYYDVGSDDWNSYLPYYQLIIDTVKSGYFSTFNFALGTGNSMFSIGLQWLDPFLPILFLPMALPNLILLLIFVKIIVIATIVYRYLSFFTQDEKILWLGVMLYSFGSYIIIWGQHYFFLTGVFYFTLLLYGLEKFIRTEKMYWLFFGLTLGLIGSLYFMFYAGIFFIFYFLARLNASNNWHYLIKHALALFILLIFAFLLAAFSVLPMIDILSNSPRIVPHFSFDVFYGARTILVNISRFYSPILMGINDFQGNFNFYEDFLVYTSILFPLLLPIYFIDIFKDRRKRWYILLILLAGTPFFFPSVSYLFNKFVNPATRYAFFYLLLSVLLIVSVLQNKISRIPLYLSCFINIAVLVFFVFYFEIKDLNIVLFLLFLFVAYTVSLTQNKFNRLYLLGGVLILELFVTYYKAIFTGRSVVNSSFVEQKYGYYDNTKDITTKLRRVDNSFYRIYRNYISVFMNDAAFSGYYGFDTYNSLSNAYFNKFRNAFDIKNGLISETWQIGDSPSINDRLNDNLFLYTLLGAKYFISDGRKQLPFGYTKIDAQDSYTVYKNNYYLPLGFYYAKDNCVNDFSFLNLTVTEKQKLLTHSYVIEKCLNDKEHDDISVLDNQVDSFLTEENYRVELQGNQIFIYFANPVSYLHLNVQLSISNFHDLFGRVYVKANPNDAFSLANAKHFYIEESGKAKVYLEYPQITELVVEVYNPDFSFLDITMQEQNFKNYLNYNEILRQKGVAFEYNKKENSFSVQYDAAEEGVVVMYIPYDKYWKVDVNGKPVDILLANIGFIGVPVQKGHNQIHVYYVNDKLRQGIIVSIATSILLFLVFLVKQYKRKLC